MRNDAGLAGAVAAALLFACTGERAAADEGVHVYACPDGAQIAARFLPGRAEVLVDGRVFSLPQAVSASGARYAEGGVTFWSKGREALFEQESGPAHRGCVTDRP